MDPTSARASLLSWALRSLVEAVEVKDEVRVARAVSSAKEALEVGPPPGTAFVSDLAAAQQAVVQALQSGGKGINCPCCNQLCCTRRRHIYAKMAVWLIWLTKRYFETRSWVHVANNPLGLRGGDYAKLSDFGLAVPATTLRDPSSPGSGYWAPTENGVRYVRGEIQVPKYLYMFNDQVLGRSDGMASIVDALGDQFDYQRLLAGDWTYAAARVAELQKKKSA